MRLYSIVLPILLILACIPEWSAAQDSSMYQKLYNFPGKFFNQVNKKSLRAEQQLANQTEKYLNKLQRREQKLKARLWKKDSAAAKELFGDINARYARFNQSIAGNSNLYSGHLDSMQTALRFLSQQNIAATNKVISNYTSLQQTLNHTNDVKKLLSERQQYLKQQLQRFGLTKQFRKFQKDVYYYRAQVDEYKRMFEDPSKLEARLLQIANKLPAFRNFFSKHSMLANMFRIPGAEPASIATLTGGLQTRASVQQNLLQRFGTGPNVSRAMQQNIQSAQLQINQLKNKINQFGGKSSDMDMPNFKPNEQKTKSFWNRIELGANAQSIKSNQFFPVTSDLALTAGYKLNNRSTAGIGASYKMGWGQNFRNIKITHEGISLRSFFDVQLKGSFYASGGFEYNYQQPFSNVRHLQGIQNWQESGLIGVSKVVAVQSKLFKKTKVQLLWDFLSYRQVPRAQPLKFRIGYNFK